MTSGGSSRNWDLKLHGAGPGEPCPPLHPLFVRVLSMRSLGITLLISIGNVKKRQYLKIVIQIWRNGRNLVQISFSQRKHQIKSWKKKSETAWSPCVLDSVKAGLYYKLWRHRIPRLRADNRVRENAYAESERQSSTWKLLIHLKKLKTDCYIWLSHWLQAGCKFISLINIFCAC